MHLCSPRPTPCFSHGFSNHSRKTGPTLLAVLMGSRPTSRTACGEKGRDHPPLIFTSSCFTAGAGLPTSDPMFRWPDYFQLKPSTETQLCALMCRQLHSKDRGVTHVVVQRGRKPEAERLPPGPSFFVASATSVECAQAALLCALPLQPQKKSLSCCASHVCAKGLARPGHSLKERNCKPKRAVHGRFRSEDHGVCPRVRAGLARSALDTSASCRIAPGLTQSSDKPAPPSFLPPSSPSPPSPRPLSPSPLPKSSRTRREGLGKSFPHRVFLREMKELERILSQTSSVWLSQRPNT